MQIAFVVNNGDEGRFQAASSGGPITIGNVYYVPDLGQNLISLGAITQKDVTLKVDDCTLQWWKDGRLIATSHRISDKLYEMDFDKPRQGSANVAQSAASLQVWHERFGHVNYRSVQQLAKGTAVDGMKVATADKGDNDVSGQVCEACVFGKQCRKPFHTNTKRAEKPGDLVHFDVFGPMSQP